MSWSKQAPGTDHSHRIVGTKGQGWGPSQRPEHQGWEEFGDRTPLPTGPAPNPALCSRLRA